MVADGRSIEHVHDIAVDILNAMPTIDQNQRAFENLTPAQKIIDQKAPFLDHILGRFGKAIAGHIDQAEAQRLAHVEEVQLLRAAWRIGRAGQAIAVGQRIDQR